MQSSVPIRSVPIPAVGPDLAYPPTRKGHIEQFFNVDISCGKYQHSQTSVIHSQATPNGMQGPYPCRSGGSAYPPQGTLVSTLHSEIYLTDGYIMVCGRIRRSANTLPPIGAQAFILPHPAGLMPVREGRKYGLQEPRPSPMTRHGIALRKRCRQTVWRKSEKCALQANRIVKKVLPLQSLKHVQ